MSTHDGGKPNVKDVHNYKHPTGPQHMHKPGPGLGGATNHGNTQRPTGGKTSGSVGNGGTNYPYGSQECD